MNKTRCLTEMEMMKKNQTNSGAEEYKEWNEKCNRELQQNTQSNRRICELKEVIWNYPVKGEKR